MQKKGSKRPKKTYWEMLVKEIINQFDDQQATFHYLPKKLIKVKKIAKPLLNSSKTLFKPFPINYDLGEQTPHKRHQLAEPFTHIYLTQREIESIKAILEEKTIIAAAVKLKLSPRTLEFYFNNVKKKLSCRKKKEVLEMIQFYDLLNS